MEYILENCFKNLSSIDARDNLKRGPFYTHDIGICLIGIGNA